MGRAVQFGAWVSAEWETMRTLYEAHADVPAPISRTDNCILMTHVGDEEESAPVLANVSLERDEAEATLRRIMKNVELFLANDLVHADLSAFNILCWDGVPTIIDLPQAVDARTNPNALMLLERDLRNVYKYFSRYGVAADPARIANDLWRMYKRGRL
ncbi:MAG: hypothetical protein GEU28_14745 [Dehalococcoidia bacterium]|nr:hypothetical protein [Dehalococcoidia bacterium]